MTNHLYILTGFFLIITSLGGLAQPHLIDSSSQKELLSQNPKSGKIHTYFPDGSLSTVNTYRKGQLFLYLDYLPNGQLFQRIAFKDNLYHGVYQIWSEEEGSLIKGKMRNGFPYSGKFEVWDEEIKKYRILNYRKGKVVSGKSTFQSH